MRPRHAAWGLALCLGLASASPADEGGSRAVLEALGAVLPAGQAPPGLTTIGEVGTGLAFGAPLRAARLAARALDASRSRLEAVGKALAAAPDQAAAGPVHRELELRQIELGDARILVTRLAEALEAAAHRLEPSLGAGALRPALALEEILRQADGDLTTMARALRGTAGELDRARRAVDRMLALVEEIQDRSTAPSRERVRLAARDGASERLSRGLLAAAAWLDGAKRSLADAQGLIRIRYLSLIEALRNLAGPDRDDAKPRPLAGLPQTRERVEAVRDELLAALAAIETGVDGLEAGRDAPPEIPPLPPALFGVAAAPTAPARDPARPRDEALDLLDELEGDLDRETVLIDDPLSAGLAQSFRARHGLAPREPGGDPVATTLAGILRDREDWPGDPAVAPGPDAGLAPGPSPD